MNPYSEVLFSEEAGKAGHLGIITLNRPQVLNSLNHAMVQAMQAQLDVWAQAEHIKAIVIRAAEGRAFCAGGDLRLTFDRMEERDPAMANFFRDEYQLNRCIHHYPKPYIALLDGITMGGGVGISIHGSHRVATDKLLFAMPETGIGFFPDVGGTYFLPRLPGKLGIYLGLTGARINSDDCVALGIAQNKVASELLSDLIRALADTAFANDARATVSTIITSFAVAKPSSKYIEQQQYIDECFSAKTVEEILQKAQQAEQPICREAGEMLLKKSPTSLKVTLRALRNGDHLGFDECMRQEYRLVTRFLQEHDFIEGIRAVIIDKDQTPHWQPNSLAAVSEAELDHYFAPLAAELV